MIVEVNAFGPVDTNAVLIGCPITHKAVVIDLPMGSALWLEQRMKALGLTLDKIFLTHSHWDHIADVCLVKEQTRATLYVHEKDAPNLQHPGCDGLPLFFPIQGSTADHLLQDGESIALGSLTFSVLHTPGHSPGGVCFYLEKEKLLLAGDTFFRGAIGKVDFATGERQPMKHSLKKILLLPEDVRVISGHGKETTIGQEKPMLMRTIERL